VSTNDLRDVLRDLAAITDPDALLEWALAVLPLRNRVPQDVRAALDAAFVERAGELGPDLEVFLALAPQRLAPDEPSPAPAI
jgi:hypothetical protein